MELIQVPRSLIDNTAMDPMRVHTYIAMTLFGCDGDDLVQFCGYSALNRHAGSAANRIRALSKNLIELGYMGESQDQSFVSEGFGSIYLEEFDSICNLKHTTLNAVHHNPSHILLVLACIRCNMRREKAMPQYYSNLLCRIADRIGISARAVSICVRALEELDIIHCEELPRYKDGNGQWHSNVRVFVNRHGRLNAGTTYSWQKETERSIKMILTNASAESDRPRNSEQKRNKEND